MMNVNDLINESIELVSEKQYTEAIKILHQAWDGITDKSTQITEQIVIQSWIGCCYFEQAMKAKDTDHADKLFRKAIKHYRKWLRLIKADEQNDVQKQISALSWLGRCYFERAKKTKDTDKRNKLFERAVKHYQKWLQLAKKLIDEQLSVQQQISALSWLVGCYFEQSKKTKDVTIAGEIFGQAIEFYEKVLKLTDKLADHSRIWQQAYVRSWLGRFYLEHAKKTKDTDKASNLFEKATEHHQEWLRLIKANRQNDVQQQTNAQSWLGCCYLEWVKRIGITSSEAEKFIKQATEYFSPAYEQLSRLSDEAEKKVIEKRIRQSLRDIDYLNKKWISYFEKKKQEIQESLFQGKTSQPQDAVATVLAVLHITPIELGFTPMAHYTSPHVCHILFGIGGSETASPMRLGSSTYMNDPSEGKALLDLLNQQDLELENKADGASHNAFFTCFSSRVNDLNQFRLYGKEGGVEASGCCLVFNKNGDWLKESDISVPFRGLSEMSGQSSDDLPEAVFSDNEYEKLPLYQVAYIAYQDEYIADKKCEIWLSAPNKAFDLHQNLAKENLGSSIRFTLNSNISRFGIRLKPVGNEEWHQFRLEKLKEALEELIRFFKDKSAVSDEDKEALEYIRYLFKDFAFRDEEEFRLLVIKPIDPDEINYCETTQSIYVPYADIRNQVDEVILGTNYEKTGNQRKAEVFRYQMKQKCPDVKVSRSTLPINPPNK
ncbi:tetratricopeptide repeat protein [Neisseria sp. Marseille-Q2251]|uniref:tetratricopeptide repeat protein n=1 Tax=Neisseria sp. Marseille-Q2251 TaxID=2866585 RepID=UPI00313985C6